MQCVHVPVHLAKIWHHTRQSVLVFTLKMIRIWKSVPLNLFNPDGRTRTADTNDIPTELKR